MSQVSELGRALENSVLLYRKLGEEEWKKLHPRWGGRCLRCGRDVTGWDTDLRVPKDVYAKNVIGSGGKEHFILMYRYMGLKAGAAKRKGFCKEK